MTLAFGEIDPLLAAFAQRQNLLLEKHYGEGFCRLKFARKRGGIAAIVVAVDMARGQSYRVSALWWIDDYHTTIRRLKVAHVGEFRRQTLGVDVLDMLQAALDTIGRWKPKDLDQVEGPFPLWHEKMTREQFEALTSTLPRRP
jgi:hypothetical protein